MRVLVLLAAAGLAAAPAHANAQGGQQRDEQNAARAMQQSNMLPFPEIRRRVSVTVPNAQYIGVEIIGGVVYRFKFMRGAEVIWIDVDARTGRIIARTGR